MNNFLLEFSIFLSAFLLFQIELIIGKAILPFYGGNYLVWGASVVFFQAILCAGYFFAYYFLKQIGIRKYLILHLCLMSAAAFFFPGHSLSLTPPSGNLPLVVNVFLQLNSSIGFVFFVLSTVSIVGQVWAGASDLSISGRPSVLYAVSNLGSFAALLTYPFLFEYYFDLNVQEGVWRFMYGLLAGLSFLAFFRIKTQEKKTEAFDFASFDMSKISVLILFSGTGVIFFLAVTNIITLTIAPIPLLWVIPLAIYLLSFVLNFKAVPWCPEWIEKNIGVVISIGVTAMFLKQKFVAPALVDLVVFLGLLAFLCMYCQRQLYRLKPSDYRQLPTFYFYISLGSFLGGFFITWIIPVISNSVVEFFVGYVLMANAMMLMGKKLEISGKDLRWIGYLLIALYLWPQVFKTFDLLGVAFFVVIAALIVKELTKKPFALLVCLAVLTCLWNFFEVLWTPERDVFKYRNYYGVYRVYDIGGRIRFFLHGPTLHGAQYLDPLKGLIPLTYYSRKSPLVDLLERNDFGISRIAVQGLGVGTIAAYSTSLNTIDFFELDPDIFKIANKYFSYLKNAPGKINYYFGDARLSLQRLPDKKYDLIISDVYSGESIPVHMATKEAIQEYRKHLTPKGILVFHISSRYVEHAYAICATAQALGGHVGYSDREDVSVVILGSTYMAVVWDEGTAEKLFSRPHWIKVPTDVSHKYRNWTDAYSTVLPYIKFKNLLSDLKIPGMTRK